MRFLLDQGLPRSTVLHLAHQGILSEHVGALGLATASDASILEEARMRRAIVVTLDSDFHALLAKSYASCPSVIRIRIQSLKGDEVAAIVRKVNDAVSKDLLAGAAVTVSARRIAVRRLPLLSQSLPPHVP
jgi:predicted nuclease of predicted toxin-antitoxin system